MVRRSTWILLAVLAVALLAFLGWRRGVPGRLEPTVTPGPESPWSISADHVESVRVTDLTGPTVVVLRRDPSEGWRMLAPVLGPADAGRIEAAVAGVLAPAVRQDLAAVQDLEPFGLAPARYRVTLLMTDGTARSMDVGELDPTGSVYYVAVPGDDRVLMISRFSVEELLGLIDSPPYPPATATPTAAQATEVP
jgi:hypothetical protein